MKKVMYNLGLVAILGLGVLANAQTKEQGAVGINTETPQATLDIKTFDANGTSVEGVLIPRVSSERAENMGESVAESTLVYITDGTTGTGTTSLVNGKGFYYYDATAKKWKKVGGGNEVTSLETITGNIREVNSITPEEWAVPGTFALVQTSGAQIKLPNPANYQNRIISVNNQYNNKVTYFNTNKPKNASSLVSGKGHLLMAGKDEQNNPTWYIIGGSY